jgi:hypothetical protein
MLVYHPCEQENYPLIGFRRHLRKLCLRRKQLALTKRSNPENKSGQRINNPTEALFQAIPRGTHEKLRLGMGAERSRAESTRGIFVCSREAEGKCRVKAAAVNGLPLRGRVPFGRTFA